MGTTLQNGVYLPNEGERNCYAGLKTNWEILDQKVADVTALQQAVAGALHREIVESLPTTDIDPNTIYMILSGTSATENVYNEFMYVNNAWELIGTSATDLTNYYTKAEVDGKLLLKASASDLTSHTGDTTIHVTTADKTKWNNGVSQSYVLRYSSASVTDNSTIAYSTLDNADNIKSGDKIIDSDGKIFSIVSVDIANQTVTVGSALIDLALDANVVHTSGNETIAGVKNFTDETYIKSLNFTNEVASPSSSNSAVMPIVTTVTYTDQSSPQSARLNLRITANGDKSLYPHENNQYALGLTSRKWSEIHGVTYYYGSDNVEFSTKFVTTDTAQTISGEKTFSSRPIIHNSNATVQADIPNLVFKNPLVERASTTLEGFQQIRFVDKNANNIGTISAQTYTSGTSDIILTSYSQDGDATRTTGVVIRRSPTASKFHPYFDNVTALGETNRRWSRVYSTEYYYGSNNVEFSTKFVTTDTAQTISGNKTFSSDLSISNTDTTANTPNLNLRNYKADRGTTDTAVQSIGFLDKNGKALTSIESRRISNGNTATNILCYNTDDSNNTVSGGIAIIKGKNDTSFAPNTDNAVNCGRALAKWSDVQTYKVNNLKPSSLSLPDIDNKIDISSYITNLAGDLNNYTPTVNGWICIQTDNSSVNNYIRCGYGVIMVKSNGNGLASALSCLIPVIANNNVGISVKCTTLSSAYFIPCQGNI